MRVGSLANLAAVVGLLLLAGMAMHLLGGSAPPPSIDDQLTNQCVDSHGDPVGIDALRRPLIQYEHAACRLPAERLQLPLAERVQIYEDNKRF